MKTVITFIISVVLFVPVFSQISEQELHRFEGKLDSISVQYNIPSIGYSIVSSGGVLKSGAVGLANIEEGREATPQTLYRVGSVTKSFVALGILRLVEEGRLSLEDPLRELIPDLDIQNRWEQQSPVLLKHLLEHTAGFRDIYLREFAVEVDAHIPPLEEIVHRYPEYWKSRWEPGTRHAYSNNGYSLLGLIIENASGMPYEDYLAKVILDPVGMENSDFRGSDHRNLAYSYNDEGELQQPRPIYDHPAGYLHTTPDDMGKFVHWMLNKTNLNDEPLISEELFRNMERPLSIIGADERMAGYGLGNYTVFAKGYRGQGHSGGIDQYLSNYSYFEETGVGFYYTMTHMSINAFQEINSLLYELLLKEENPVPPYQLYQDPDEITGWYSPKSYRIELMRIADELFNPVRIFMDGDTLRLSNLTGLSMALSHDGDNYFRAADEPVSSLWVGRFSDKTVLSSSRQGAGGYFEQKSFLRVMWKTILFSFSFLWIILSLIGTPGIYLYKLIRKQNKENLHTGAFLYQFFAGLLLILMILLSMQLGDLNVLATMNSITIGIAAISVLMPVMIILGLIAVFKNSVFNSNWGRYLIYVTYGSWVIFLGILLSYGLIPFITWLN
ncbi:MAG: class A beta-lactamase-related serine hydrolase [Balneolaceae bacterium]|nr:MAG: class A beta-lactamase-related serine hydrolase [Balneolaceae bacterium]